VVLFDIDDTLISTGGASNRAWDSAVRECCGVAADVGAHTGRGVPDPGVAQGLLRSALGREPQPAELERLLELRLRALATEIERAPEYAVKPGVEPLLLRLQAEGCLLGLVSGNVEAAARVKLGRSGLGRFFSFGGFGSDSPDRAELTRTAVRRAEAKLGGGLDRASTVVVGDTPRDVQAAHAAGVRAVGVATGGYTVEELEAAGADFTVASLEEWSEFTI
jgi:phosphoglycolate phosphatase-like HAD superfamily hydrolase